MVCLRTFLLDMRRHAIKCHVPTIHRGLPSNLSRLALTRRAQSPQIAIWKRPYRAHRVQYTPRSGLIEDWKPMKMWANTHNIPFMMNMWCAYAFRLRSCVSMLLYGITANVILLSLQMQQQWLQQRRLEVREKKHAETRHSSFVERKPFSLFCCPCSIYENGERERVRSCVSVFMSMWFELCDCFCFRLSFSRLRHRPCFMFNAQILNNNILQTKYTIGLAFTCILRLGHLRYLYSWTFPLLLLLLFCCVAVCSFELEQTSVVSMWVCVCAMMFYVSEYEEVAVCM